MDSDSDHSAMDSDDSDYEATDPVDDNANYTEYRGDGIPPILNPELRDVFPIFASMLSLRSLLDLASTCKEMQEICLNDKRIHVKVKVENVDATSEKGAPLFKFEPYKHCGGPIFLRKGPNFQKKFLSAIHRMSCVVILKSLDIWVQSNSPYIPAIRKYMEKLGVKNITLLKIKGNFTEWPEIFVFIRDYNVKNVYIYTGIPKEHLVSMLKTQLSYLYYDGNLSMEILLEHDSPIGRISFSGSQITNDIFMQILWKIQTGALKTLVIPYTAVDWASLNALDFCYSEPLPEDRPLVFSTKNPDRLIFWVLHYHGGVTKCHASRPFYSQERRVTIEKCKERSFPPALRPVKKNVSEELHAKKEGYAVECTLDCFLSCFGRLIDGSYRGPIPEERPLLFAERCPDASAKKSYFLLNEDGSLDNYTWYENVAEYAGHYDSDLYFRVRSFALSKYVFLQAIQSPQPNHHFRCKADEFNCLFGDFKTLPFDHRGPLPEERPLLTRNGYGDRFLLMPNNSVIQCRYIPRNVWIEPCSPEDIPPVFRSRHDFDQLLQDISSDKTIECAMELETFRGGFDGFKKLPFDYDDPLPDDRPLVFESNEVNEEGRIVERRCLIRENGTLTCTWKEGQVLVVAAKSKEFPKALKKKLALERLQKQLS